MLPRHIGWLAVLLLTVAFVGCEEDRLPRGEGSAGTGTTDPGEPTSDDGRWVEALLIGADFGNDTQFVHRWNHSPHIEVTGDPNLGMPNDALDSAVQRLNATIAESAIHMAIGNGNDIAFYVGTPDELDGYKTQEGIPLNFNGSAFTWWTEDGNLTHAAVLLDSSEINDVKITEGLARALGVLGSSDIFVDSLFVTGDISATMFFGRDAMLMEFLYTQLDAGASTAALRNAFNAWWPEQ